MALECKEMQKLYEAPTGCLHGDAIPFNLQYNVNFEEGSSNPNEENGSHSVGGIHEDGLLHASYFVPPIEGYHGPVYPQDCYVWSTYPPDNQKAQQNHYYPLEKHYYPINQESFIQDDNRFQYVPFKTQSQLCHSEFNVQDFQYFVVIDFEATCDKDKNPHPQEIIEFPSVLVNSSTGQLEDQFQVYVRPTHNQQLSDFCKELTGIQQSQVDKGVPLSVALYMHDRWLEEKGVKKTNFVVVTWSNWDCRVMLESECRYKQIRKPSYFNRWINLRVPFHEVFGMIRCNLKEAVQLAGLSWEGRAHCGLDDAKNTARLLTNLMYRGIQFTITNSFVLQPSGLPLTMQQLKMQQLTVQQPSLISPQPQTLQQLRTKPQLVPFVQLQVCPGKEHQHLQNYCFCGVKCRRLMVHKPGEPDHGYFYFCCGNWAANGGPCCPYFLWATL